MPQICFNLNSVGRPASNNEAADVRGPGALQVGQAVMQVQLAVEPTPKVVGLTNVERLKKSAACNAAAKDVNSGDLVETGPDRSDLKFVPAEATPYPDNSGRRIGSRKDIG